MEPVIYARKKILDMPEHEAGFTLLGLPVHEAGLVKPDSPEDGVTLLGLQIRIQEPGCTQASEKHCQMRSST